MRQAIANILFGEVNPSANCRHVSASVSQLPRP